MSTTVNTGWLKDNYGEKFAPKTLASQVVTPDGKSFVEEIQEQLENVDVGIEITKAEYDALGDVVLTDGKTYFITDIDGGGSGSGGGIANTDGVVINVEIGNWEEQSDGTYTNTIDVENVSIDDVYDISLCGDYSEEQAYAFDFLVSSIDTYNNKVVLTASEEITVAFSIVLRGKVNLENKNVYVSDLSATNIEYDNSESNIAATDMQNAIDELATSVNGIVVNVTTDSWDLQDDGTYKKVIYVEQLTGKEKLDVCLNPEDNHTEEQITAYSELITSIDTAEGRLILTASEAIAVEFRILLYGKIGFNVEVVENTSGSGNADIIKLTQVEFDALPEEQKSNGIYVVTDAEEMTAKNLAYDDSETGLGVNNVQDAIVEQNKKVYEVNSNLENGIDELNKTINENCISMTKLWENANPTSQFAPQTISLSKSGYDIIKILFSYSDSEQGIMANIDIVNTTNKRGVAGVFDDGLTYAARRIVVITSSGVQFLAAIGGNPGSSNPSTNNYMCIPAVIYGIKGVK